jgi:hypothetical protein
VAGQLVQWPPDIAAKPHRQMENAALIMVVKGLIDAAARLTVMTQEATALAALMDDR